MYIHHLPLALVRLKLVWKLFDMRWYYNTTAAVAVNVTLLRHIDVITSLFIFI